MPSKQAVSSARATLNSSFSLLELSARLQGLSITNQRSFHVTCRCQANPSLHGAKGDATGKGTGLGLASKSPERSSGPNKTQKSRLDLAREREKMRKREVQDNIPLKGGLASNSIFADEIPPPKKRTPEAVDAEAKEAQELEFTRNPETLAQVLNPRPRARALWQRKMLIRTLQKRGRLTKAEVILQTERSHLVKSHFFKTSMKKLAPLARQISGKTVDEAILQMRFSKKKVAQDVRAHLIHARNEAIVAKGMGSAALPAALPDPKTATPGVTPSPLETMTEDTSILPLSPTHVPTLALKCTIATPETQIYIAQAWVNRGPYGKELEPRAMGRANILRPPHTGLSVLLKEEKTRMREEREKEEKDQRQRLGSMHWRQLRDWKVYQQRPYYSW